MADRKIKVSNPNKHRVGLRLMDGIREMVVYPNSFTNLDESEIYFINSMSRIFSSKHLVIEDETISQDLGYGEKSIESLKDDEISTLLKGNILKLKKQLETVTEKHMIDKVIEIAKKIDDLQKNKITFLQEWSGYDFGQLIEDDKTEDEK